MSGDRFETLIADGVDRIALPPESEWLPDPSRAAPRRLRPSRLVFVPLVAAVLVLAAVLGAGLRSVREQSPGAQPSATAVPVIVPSEAPPTTGALAVCRSDQLSGTYENNGVASGSYGVAFRLAVATGSCEAPANPPVRFLDATGAVVLSATLLESNVPIPLQTLRASAVGKDAGFLQIQWSGHGIEPGYRCVAMGPPIASVAVDLGRPAGGPANLSNVLVLDVPPAQRLSFCVDPPERVSASIVGSRPATPGAIVSPPTTGDRLVLSDAPLGADGRAFVLMQRPGEERLHGVSWDASTSGVLPGRVPAGSPWSQSPDGARYLLDGRVYDRAGALIGVLPWQGKGGAPTWTPNGRQLCVALPELPIGGGRALTGAPMRLEMAAPGEAARVIAAGYGTYTDNSVFAVLACDPGADRAIVAQFGQGVSAARLWAFRLSTGAVLRSVEYGGPSVRGAWVTATADGGTIAESSLEGQRWTTTIRRADDGVSLGTIVDFEAQGFAGDGSLVVGQSGPNAVAVVNWKTGRRIWSATGLPYGGYLPEPSGRSVAIGVGFVGGSDVADVYIVDSSGSSVLLPPHIRVGLRY